MNGQANPLLEHPTILECINKNLVPVMMSSQLLLKVVHQKCMETSKGKGENRNSVDSSGSEHCIVHVRIKTSAGFNSSR